MNNFSAIMWLVLLVGFVVLEAVTVKLLCIWFAAGSLAAMVVSLLGGAFWLQLLVFVVVSAVALVLTRPLAKKMLDKKKVPTNADRLIGTRWKVTETIDNDDHQGAVYADGKIWTARSEDGRSISAGETVEVLRLKGVKLIVRSCEESRQCCGVS